MAGIFRRLTNPVLVPVTTAPTAANAAKVADGFIPKRANSFQAVNSNMCWVRLMGTSTGTTASVVDEGKGWLWPPGFVGVYSTQSPIFMSAMAVERPGYPLDGLTFVPLEICYGEGA